jgi:hypothetical protein
VTDLYDAGFAGRVALLTKKVADLWRSGYGGRIMTIEGRSGGAGAYNGFSFRRFDGTPPLYESFSCCFCLGFYTTCDYPDPYACSDFDCGGTRFLPVAPLSHGQRAAA